MKLSSVGLASLIIAGTYGTCVVAQELPDPPAENDDHDQADLRAFSEAYRRAGEPRILLTRITSDVSAKGDADGMAAMLQADIEQQLLNEPELRLLTGTETDIAVRREQKLSKLSGDQWTPELRTATSRADLHVLMDIRCNEQLLKQGIQLRILIETMDVSNGRKLPMSFSFDWMESAGSAMSKQYARAVVRRWMDAFSHYYNRPDGDSRNYLVAFSGVADASLLRRARNCFAKIDGVSRVFDRDMETAQGSSLASLEIRYNGSWLDLVDELQSHAADELKMQVKGVDGNRGAISLIARKKEPWQKLVDPLDPEYAAALAEFRAAYVSAGVPRLSATIQTQKSNVLTAQFAASLQKGLRTIGVTVMDGTQPACEGASIAPDAPSVRMTPEIQVRISERKTGDRTVFIAQAVRTRDGLLLATATRDVVVPKGNSDVMPALESVSTATAAELAAGMQAQWADCAELTVRVLNASSLREVNALRNLFADNISSIVRAEMEETHTDGSKPSVFRIHFRGAVESLVEQMMQLGESTAFRIDFSNADRQSLALRVLP